MKHTKQICAILLLLTMLLTAMPVLGADSGIKPMQTNTKITLLSEARSSAGKIAELPKNAVVAAYQKEGSYTFVQYGDATGYVLSKRLKAVNTSAVVTGIAITRQETAFSGTTAKNILKGDVVSVLMRGTESSIVRHGTDAGFIKTEDLSVFGANSERLGTVQNVSSSKISIMNGTGKNAKAVSKLAQGETADLLAAIGDTAAIVRKGTDIGLISTAKLTIQTGEASSAPETAEINTQYVEVLAIADVYSQPRTSGRRIGEFYPGSIARCNGTVTGGEWVEVLYSGQRAYIRRSVVQATDYTPKDAVSTANDEEQNKAFIAYMNAYRQSEGAGALKADEVLMDMAEIRVRELVTKFSHTRPNGGMPPSLHKSIVGENIARGASLPIASSAAKAFMASVEHKKVAMNKIYTKTGAACLEVDGVYYWVQLFGL